MSKDNGKVEEQVEGGRKTMVQPPSKQPKPSKGKGKKASEEATITAVVPEQVDPGLEAKVSLLEKMVAEQQEQLKVILESLESLTVLSGEAPKVAGGAGNTTLPTWEGHSSLSIVRSLSNAGLKPAGIKKCLAELGLTPSDNSVSTQHQLAQHGKAGANLTAEQVEKLNEVIKKVLTPVVPTVPVLAPAVSA